MEKGKRKTVFSGLEDFCVLSKKHDFIEVCEWTSGEGFDVTISEKELFSLTYGEFKALKKAVKKLKRFEEEQKKV